MSDRSGSLPACTLTFFSESPCLSCMYFRKAVVHWRVVALSVSALQNGTRRFNSSQQMRILRLPAKSKRHIERMTQNKAAKRDCATQRTTAQRPSPRARTPVRPWGTVPIHFSRARSRCLDQGWVQPPGIGSKTVCVRFRCFSQATDRPWRAQDSDAARGPGFGCPWVPVKETAGCQPATSGDGLFRDHF